MYEFDQSQAGRPRTRLPAQNRKQGGGTLLGIFIGLVLGVLIAFGVTLVLKKTPLPFQDKYEGAPKPGKDGMGSTNGGQTPLALPGKPGDKPVGQQRFEFYGILEGKQPETSEAAAPASAPPAVSVVPSTAPKPEAKDVFFLQVGAFQKAADADNLKAQLALNGLDASVSEVTLSGKGTVHRVRLGPYRNADELNRARGLLSQAGMQGTIVKQ